MKNNEESLLSNPLYKEVYEKTEKPNLGTFYMDYASYFNAMTALEGTDYPLTLKKGFDMAMMMATSAEDEGLKILAKVVYKGDINLNDLEPSRSIFLLTADMERSLQKSNHVENPGIHATGP